MYIKFFKSFLSNKEELVEVTPYKRIKDNECFKDIDLTQTIIYVNGFQKDENYVLREDDICTVRYFPSNSGGGSSSNNNWVVEIVLNVLTLGGYATTKEVNKLIKEAIKGIQTNYNYNYDYSDRSTNYITNITENYIQANNAVKSPEVRGCSNKTGLDQPYPFVLGRTYCSPILLAMPYTTPADTLGTRQTYHALFNLGYNNISVTDICLGLHLIATNNAKTRSGEITIDGDYDATKYGIHLEIQTSDEVSLFPQKVTQQEINTELLYPEGELGHGLILDEISSLYPQKVDIEFYLDGLVGKTSEGKEATGTVKIKIEYSIDGGNTYQPFAQIGAGVSGSSYNSSTGETTISMKQYHSMRLVATKTFSASEVFNAVNHVVEFRIQRTSVHVEDNYIYDTVSLACIRTYCYDPDLSSSSELVIQAPVCQKDRQRLTRLGFTITSDDNLYDFSQFNCTLQALGRTCTESNGYFTWSNEETETCNPASMALKLLQSPMLGADVYSDNEIDLQSFGELYKFCNEYDIDDAQGNHVGICCNGIVTKQQKLSDLLSQILVVGRAYRIFNNNKISLFIDKPITYTTMILNNQNVLSAVNTKNFDELPSGLRIKFVNEDNFSQEDNMYIDYADAPARSSTAYTTQTRDFTFQTNVEQIKKNGLYELARMKLRPETWERKVTTEGCLAYVGCKIEVQDDTISVGIGDGAEIKGLVYDDEESPAYITEIVTDGKFDVTDLTQEYGIKIQQTSLTYGIVVIKKKVVITQIGTYYKFVLDEPISLNENVTPCIGDIVSFGIYSKITYESICMGKKGNGDGTYDLTLVPYVEAIYTADSGELPEFNSLTSVPQYVKPAQGKPPLTQEDIQDVRSYVDTGSNQPPNAPTWVSLKAYENYIEMKCVQSGAQLKDTVKYYEFEITKGTGAEPIIIKSGSNNFNYVFDRATDGYPEKNMESATDLGNWTFRVRVVNVYDIASNWVTCESKDYTQYGTWKIPNITVDKEIIDRTVILTAVYGGSQNVMGHIKTLVRIKRTGNDDPVGDTAHPTFNEMLDISADSQFYTPEFNLPVQTSSTDDNEGNYRKDTTTAYESGSNKITHTLPLIGQTYRIFKEGNVFTGTFTKDVEASAEIPLNPEEGDVFQYTGSETSSGGVDFHTDAYYLYESGWVQVYSKAIIVPTSYVYEIQMINEAGSLKASNTVEVSATALCTNIADIVHSHEHYKNLYVEKLSAINANIGMISEGGMGDFENKLNYWALSNLSPDETGIAGGVKQGAFRVGGTDQYFKVEPDPNDPTKFNIELRAGSINLTSESDQNGFVNGTRIFDGDPATSLRSLLLTASGMLAQTRTYDSQTQKYSDWVISSRVEIDEKDNLIITNADSVPDIGNQVTGYIYHFNSDATIQDEETAEGVTPTNPEGIAYDGETVDNTNLSPLLNITSSPRSIKGNVIKGGMDVFSGYAVFLNKAEKVRISSGAIKLDGSFEENIPAPLIAFNDAMKQASVLNPSITVGEYLGLTSEQIEKGIFY